MFRVRDYFYFDNFVVGWRLVLLVVLVEELAHFFGAGGFFGGSGSFGVGRGLRGVDFGPCMEIAMNFAGCRPPGGGSSPNRFRFRIFLRPLRWRLVRCGLLWTRWLLLLCRILLR